MTTTDTNLTQLIINQLTQAQYDTITPNANELYITTDGVMQSTDVINALGYTPANNSLSNVSSINSNSAVQTALDGKVSKAGDTMTGDLFISEGSPSINLDNTALTKGSIPSGNCYTEILFNDGSNDSTWANKRLAILGYTANSEGGVSLTMRAYKREVGTTTGSALVVGYDANGNAYSTAPTPASGSSDTNIATTKWVNDNNAWTLSYSQLVNSATTMNATTTLSYSLATYLPSDNYIYEVMYSARGATGTTSGNEADIAVGSGLIDVSTHRVAAAQTRTSNSVSWAAAGIMLIGSTTAGSTMRVIYIRQSGSSSCTLNYFRVYAYRRLNYAL